MLVNNYINIIINNVTFKSGIRKSKNLQGVKY